MQPAQPAIQLLGERQSYRGGWPLGFTTATCPAEAPVGCQSNPAYNLNCCPSGQFCYGTLQPYCCPTDADCGAAVKNVPVCADASWNMFQIEQVGNRDYFCCPNGYTGVLPSSGAAGICEASGAGIPTSRLATMASQIGGTSVTPFGGSPTATLGGVAPSTTGRGADATTPTGTARGETPTGASSPGDGVGGSSTVPIGAIAGIAVGGVAILVLAVALLLWLHRRSLRKRPPPAAAARYPVGDVQEQKIGSTQYDMPTQGGPPQSRSELTEVARVEMG